MSGQHNCQQTDGENPTNSLNFSIHDNSSSAPSPSPLAMTQQGLLNQMLHPALQQSMQLQSVANYAMQQGQQQLQQHQQQQLQPQQMLQNVYPTANYNTSTFHHINIEPKPGTFGLMNGMIPSDVRHVANEILPSPAPMAASSINVSTASYEAPRIQNRTKKAKAISLAAQNTSPVRLAAVPTRNLASRSIISLNLNPNLENNSCSTSSQQTEQLSRTVIESQLNSIGKDKEGMDMAVSTTSNSVKKSSSYSLACNATIRAQEELSKDTNQSTLRKNSHETCETKTPLTGKRAASDSDLKDQPHKYLKVIGGKSSSVSKPPNSVTLQQYLSNLLTSRGYSSQHYCSLEGGYYCKPSELQKASYGMAIIKAIRTTDGGQLEKILNAGLSPNPCNAFGESSIHMVCRRGDYKLLKIFLDHGSSVQVSDDFGRTPLHDACWTTKPCFKSVELLLNKDPRLLHIVDCRGSAPLSYVKQENWGQWMEFLDGQKEVWWPHRDTNVEEPPPPLVNKPPHSMPIQDPPNAAHCAHAKLIASGKITPEALTEYVSDVKNIDSSMTGRGESSKPTVDGSSSVVGTSQSVVVTQ